MGHQAKLLTNRFNGMLFITVLPELFIKQLEMTFMPLLQYFKSRLGTFYQLNGTTPKYDTLLHPGYYSVIFTRV